MTIIGIVGVLLIVGYFVYTTRPGPCDGIFEQTAPRLSSTLQLLKANGDLVIGRDKIQELTENSQKVGILCKTCCIAQQTGKVNAEQFQNCLNSTKSFETQLVKVASSIDEANTAKQRGDAQLANQKVEQAKMAAGAATADVRKLDEAVAAASSSSASGGSGSATSGRTGVEQEPNNTILQANAFPMGSTVSGEISVPDDVDYFRFHHDSKLRDMVAIGLENQSTTLSPEIDVYDYNRSSVDKKHENTGGANLALSFAAEAGKDYYVAVLGLGTVGKYHLSVIPQKAYDQYEPNDDSFSATPVTVGQTIIANVMDPNDVDWYRLSGIRGTTVTVSFENQSSTLRPNIAVFDSNKSQIENKSDGTAGASLPQFVFPTEAGKDYYMQVSPNGSSGKYKIVTQ